MTTVDFTTRFHELEKFLFGFAMRITKNAEDARDLLQETVYRAFRNRNRFQVGTNFKAWMATIMKNTFINSYRKNRKRSDLEMPIDKFMFALESKKVNDSAQSNIMMQELNGMLDSLDDDYRLPFTMFYEGFHYDEIADTMDIPIGTVKSRIFYARKQLKEKIQAHYGDGQLY